MEVHRVGAAREVHAQFVVDAGAVLVGGQGSGQVVAHQQVLPVARVHGGQIPRKFARTVSREANFQRSNFTYLAQIIFRI